MARLPDYTSLGTSVPQSNRQIVSYDTNTVPAAMARLGGALESASGKLFDVEKKQRDSATALQKAQTASALYRERVNIINDLQNQSEYEGLPEAYNARMAGALETHAAAITDPQERALFTAQWSQHDAAGLSDIYSIQRTKRKEAGLASLLQTSEDNMKSAVSANEMTGETLRRMTHDAIDLAAASGIIGADDAVRKKLAWDEQYSTMRLAGMIEGGQAADVIKMLSSSGDDNSLLQKISMIESGGNAGAVNQQSGAAGLFQFMPETAKQYGLSDADRFDPDKSKAAAAALLNDNRNALRSKLGRPPTDGELYLAHQQGATGAANLLANPDAKAVDVVGSQAVLQNGGSKDMTAGEFAAKWTRKLDSGVVGMLPVEKRLQLMRSAEADIDRERSKNRAVLSDRIKDAAAMAMEGKASPEPLTLQNFQSAYPPEDAQREFSAWQDTQRFASAVFDVQLMTPEQQAQALKQQEPVPGVGYDDAAKRRDYLAKAIEAVNKQRSADPVQFGIQRGIIPAEPIEFGDASRFTETLRQRVSPAYQAANQFGVTPRIFTKEEAEALNATLRFAPVAQKTAMLKGITQAMPDGNASAAFRQIAAEHPALAIAGAMMGLGRNMTYGGGWFSSPTTLNPDVVASRLVRGYDLLNPAKEDGKDGTGKPKIEIPQDKEFTEMFNETYGSIFANRPVEANAAINAVKAYYAARMAEVGDFTGKNVDLIQDSMTHIIGEPQRINGREVLPPWGMDAAKFKDSMTKAWEIKVKGSPNMPQFGDVKFSNAGDVGVYNVLYGDKPLFDANGIPIRLDIRQ